MIAGDLSDGAQRTNCYALVFYVGGPLAQFLDGLRAELEPGRPVPRSHVTVLPPRPIPDHTVQPESAEKAIAQLHLQSAEFAPFRTHLGGIDTFNGTNVVYLSIANGFKELERMHRRLNQEALEYQEPYPYHPHITLAQGLAPERMQAALELARARWEAYTGPRSFACDSWYFVQATLNCGPCATAGGDLRWLDLAHMKLSRVERAAS